MRSGRRESHARARSSPRPFAPARRSCYARPASSRVATPFASPPRRPAGSGS